MGFIIFNKEKSKKRVSKLYINYIYIYIYLVISDLKELFKKDKEILNKKRVLK